MVIKRILLYILVICSLFLFYGCLKNNSNPSSMGVSLDGKVYYYRLCDSRYICKFFCDPDEISSVSSLTQQNLTYACTTPVSMQDKIDLENNLYKERKDIKEKIIKPILEAKKLNIIPVSDDLLKEFDSVFSQQGNDCKKNSDKCTKCKSNCTESGAVPVPWMITKEGSNFIYQKNVSDIEVATLQWSGLIKNATKMSYEEAKKACDEYDFKYNDWSLPSDTQFQKALGWGYSGLIENILQENNQYIEDLASLIWTTDKENKDRSYYTICVRTYKP